MLDPDHDQKQAKHEAEESNVVDFPKPKKDQAIRLSKVYARGEVKENGECQWAFHICVGDNDPIGHAFATRAGAIKGRVLYQKKIKAEGFQVHCLP